MTTGTILPRSYEVTRDPHDLTGRGPTMREHRPCERERLFEAAVDEMRWADAAAAVCNELAGLVRLTTHDVAAINEHLCAEGYEIRHVDARASLFRWTLGAIEPRVRPVPVEMPEAITQTLPAVAL